MSNLMGFWAVLGQSKFNGLTLFRDVNKEGVDTTLAAVAHYDCMVDNAHTGFTYITLRDTLSVIRNQWGDRKQNIKFLDLLGHY